MLLFRIVKPKLTHSLDIKLRPSERSATPQRLHTHALGERRLTFRAERTKYSVLPVVTRSPRREYGPTLVQSMKGGRTRPISACSFDNTSKSHSVSPPHFHAQHS